MQHVSHALSDRVAQYHRHAEVLKKMEALTRAEILAMYNADVESWRLKVQQQKERLEALGVKFGESA